LSDTIETPTEETDDIRSALAAAMSEPAPTDPPPPEPDEDSEPSESSSSERARGPDGKFVKAEAEEPEVKAETPEPEAKEEAPKAEEPAGPLKSWSEAERAALAKAPKEAQDVFLKRYGDLQADYTRKTQEAAQFRKDWEPVNSLLAPHSEQMRARGFTPGSLIQGWYDAERGLMAGGQTAINLVANIVKGYGIDGAALARALGVTTASTQAAPEEPNPTAQPQIPPELANKIAEMEGFIATERQRREADQRAQYEGAASRVMNDIEQFAAAADKSGALLHPHFRTVEDDITRLVLAHRAAGQQVPPLADLYDQAVWANPNTRAAIQAEQRAADEAKRAADEKARAEETRKKAEQARRAASSVTGAPASKTVGRQTGSIREQLESAMEDLA
jgi:hypothetical protein